MEKAQPCKPAGKAQAHLGVTHGKLWRDQGSKIRGGVLRTVVQIIILASVRIVCNIAFCKCEVDPTKNCVVKILILASARIVLQYSVMQVRGRSHRELCCEN